MGNKAEQFSRVRFRHSMNQKVLKGMRERQGKYFHPNGKEAKAERRKERREQFSRQFQFDRALGNTFNGNPIEDIIDLAPENIAYVVEHIDEHEREIETYNTEKGTKVSITIVEFARTKISSRRMTNSETA